MMVERDSTDMGELLQAKSGSSDVPVPRTPRLLVSTPERSSSLAFGPSPDLRVIHSRPAESRGQNAMSPDQVRAIPYTDRLDLSPPTSGCPSPLTAAQMRHKFRAATTTLHRDILTASSPASSIESRMDLDRTSLALPGHLFYRTERENQINQNTTPWRYSLAPRSLAQASTDVREPIPSPTLPELPNESNPDEAVDDTVEPASSGFSSHSKRCDRYSAIGKQHKNLQPGSGHVNDPSLTAAAEAYDIECQNDLARTMIHLNVSAEDVDTNCHDKSGIDAQFQPESMQSISDSLFDRDIWLSETAEAAALSAKAKRRLLRSMGSCLEDIDNLDVNRGSTIQQQSLHNSQAGSNEGGVVFTACPDPAAHITSPTKIYQIPADLDPQSRIFGYHHIPPLMKSSVTNAPRATATGSPMPFYRSGFRYNTAYPTSPPGAAMLPIPFSAPHQPKYTTVEHFDPCSDQVREQIRPGHSIAYSFSTAASKAIGSTQAPDSWIRNSYKTDTLTALARPPSRYRKNGIGADIALKGVERYYHRPKSSRRPSSAWSRGTSRHTYNSDEDVRFRSSPPRGPAHDLYMPVRRKRAMDDSFVMTDSSMPASQEHQGGLRYEDSNETMEVDSQTSAAVRMSIFGSHTPEAFRKARHGINEISPNIQVYRKGTAEASHLRKKRRPSYWDNDLEEIRESPAGRGGVNSPVSAQASMRADFEIASMVNTEMDIDKEDLACEASIMDDGLEKQLAVSGGATEYVLNAATT